MVFARRTLCLLVLSAASCVMKDRDKNPEFAAQGDALDTPTAPTPPSSPPPRAAASLADAGAPPSLAGEGTSSLAIAVCPLECHIADGPRHIPLPGPQLDALRAAFGPTMSGLRQCASVAGLEDERHKPTINLRFGPRGELADVGVDPTGWDGNVEDCMQQVVRGGAANPAVSIDGPADVRCSERCEQHGRWRTAPR